MLTELNEAGIWRDKSRYALHPAQRWYLERLFFGYGVGRYVGQGGEQAFFLNSEIDDPKSNREALARALRDELGLTEQDELYLEMMALAETEYKAQEALIKELAKSQRAVIYAHNPRKLALLLKKRGIKDLEKFQFVGGHWHLGQDQSLVVPEGTLKAPTRIYIGPFAQRGMRRIFGVGIPFPLPVALHVQRGDFAEAIKGRIFDPTEGIHRFPFK